MKLLAVSLVVAVALSCAFLPPPPQTPRGPDQAVVAIQVTLRQTFLQSLWRASPEPDAIYFVPLEIENPYRQKRVFVSNYHSDDYYYVVNADSGRYAAVGARLDIHVRDSEYGVSKYVGSEFWLFPESMIDETIVSVEPSGVVFMGEFELSGDLPLEDADDTQKHYSEVFRGTAPKDPFFRFFGPDRSTMFIAEYQTNQSEMATQRFLQSSQPLTDAGWRVRTAQ